MPVHYVGPLVAIFTIVIILALLFELPSTISNRGYIQWLVEQIQSTRYPTRMILCKPRTRVRLPSWVRQWRIALYMPVPVEVSGKHYASAGTAVFPAATISAGVTVSPGSITVVVNDKGLYQIT